MPTRQQVVDEFSIRAVIDLAVVFGLALEAVIAFLFCVYPKPLKKAPAHLSDNAGAPFELVCFGVFTDLAGLPTMSLKCRFCLDFKSFFAVYPGTYALPSENGRFSQVEKLLESAGIIPNHLRFLPERGDVLRIT